MNQTVELADPKLHLSVSQFITYNDDIFTGTIVRTGTKLKWIIVDGKFHNPYGLAYISTSSVKDDYRLEGKWIHEKP